MLHLYKAESNRQTERVFKTAWFSRAAKNARITDAQLYEAITQVRAGQGDDLGGGVFKKRLNKNMHRSIVLAEGRKYWVYAYLYAKKDRANIDDDELAAVRELVNLHARKTSAHIEAELANKEVLEIHDDEKG